MDAERPGQEARRSPGDEVGERLRAARLPLAAAAAALIGGALWFDLPLAYVLVAVAALVGLTAAVPAAPPLPRMRVEREGALPPHWPDTSMKATVEALAEAALVLDAGGIVRYANAGARHAFPATRPSDAFTLTFRRPEFGEALDEARAGRTGTVEFRETGDGGNVYAMTFAPIRLPGAPPGRFILVTFDDVSDRLAVARIRTDFVAYASHELRTPLASLTGFIETLLGPARNDPVASERFLRVMLEQAGRMRRLIDDLLSLSRVEMRVHSRPTDRVDLSAVVRHVGDALAPLAEEHSVELAVTASDGPLWVVGDRDELVQVVQNLVENGIRYGASGGRVELGLTHDAGRNVAALSVRDFGPGIAPEHLPRLTERFYRVDVDASRAKKGTGLGLAIVKHVVTRHGGRLHVESEPGKGARFTVDLPLASEEVPGLGKKSI
jgi:two-component system phosphate regulon sensor histidine kinase PhoR